jgi:hypothetical protein
MVEIRPMLHLYARSVALTFVIFELQNYRFRFVSGAELAHTAVLGAASSLAPGTNLIEPAATSLQPCSAAAVPTLTY